MSVRRSTISTTHPAGATKHEDEDRAVLLPSPAPKPDAKTLESDRPGALDWKLTEKRLPGRRMRFETRCGPFTI